ncbi:MAG: membrane protein required for colicin V production [Desulfobacteraceae bacterium Eth-SRB2]|nr:MAG: membrane protein required for colicin V production [Desulfobacteraceae bacterium Eth-SRB2]
MNLFDLGIIMILCFCLIRGVFIGIIRGLFSITGVLVGFFGASAFYMEVAESLLYWMPDASYVNLMSFLTIFFGFFFTISILGLIVNYLLKIDFLSWVKRTLGAGIGIIKGILFVSVLLLTLTAFLPKGAIIIKDSLFSSYVTLLSEKMARIVSKDMKHKYVAKIEEYKKSWEN